MERDNLLHIVRRSCNNSNRPGEECKVIQVTVNGLDQLNGTVFSFAVVVGIVDRYTSEDITISIVGE